MKYRILDDLTSDVMFEAYGKDYQELLLNCAEALNNIICQSKKVREKRSISVVVKGKNEKDLLFHWLQEIIAQVDVEAMFFKRFVITSLKKEGKGLVLKGAFSGEEIRTETGETVVKGVTNYGFALEKKKEGYCARVSVDI